MKTLIKYSITAAAFCLACGAGRAAAQQQGKAPKQYDVAAYVYPAYASDDPRLRPFWPMGIGEWETVMTMQQRNPGHYWDRKPLWGYVNEADPAVMSSIRISSTKTTPVIGALKIAAIAAPAPQQSISVVLR